jgi:hypothetical protein
MTISMNTLKCHESLSEEEEGADRFAELDSKAKKKLRRERIVERDVEEFGR